MKNIAIKSKNINKMYYEEDTKNLIVFFHSGNYYVYYDVDTKTIENILSIKEDKRGKFFETKIRYVFEFKKIY